jgi:hypothetical protein
LENKIPLHSLILCSSLAHLSCFPQHECLIRKLIEHDLIGDDCRFDISQIIFDELRHRVSLKLSLGERVVVFSGDLSGNEKQQLISLAQGQGASYEEISESREDLFTAKPLLIDALKFNWKGITIVGDVHGDYDALMDVFAWAKSRNHFVWLLGDIVDYGKKT